MTPGAKEECGSFLPSTTQPGGTAPGFFAPAKLFMPRPLISLALSATLALTGASASLAADPAKTAAAQPAAGTATKASAPEAATKLVDINKASRTELKTLPGIGDTEAAKIIAARPFMTKTDLVTKNVLTQQSYDVLRSNIVVVHKGPPPKPKP
jgi:competence protein ComEA